MPARLGRREKGGLDQLKDNFSLLAVQLLSVPFLSGVSRTLLVIKSVIDTKVGNL